MYRFFAVILTYLVAFLSSNTCFAQRVNTKILGNIYVLKGICRNVSTDANLNERKILGFKVEKVVGDTLFIKYLLPDQIFLNADLVYDNSCRCYITLSGVSEAPNQVPRIAYLRISKRQKICWLSFGKEREKALQYNFSYQSTIDPVTFRDVYHAEDGFSLFE